MTTTHAVRIHKTGGPEALVYEEIEVPAPGAGEALLRQHAIGLNYIDTYQRTGLYPLSQLPAVLGMEGAGVVEAIGAGVSDVKLGQRVAYAAAPPGAYAERRLIKAASLVPLPDTLSFKQAASIMLQGMTVEYLLTRCFKVEPGMTILIHAAAGGVGLMASAWAKALGATVIGTVGSQEKAKLAQAHGCKHTIVYTREDFAAKTLALTNGEGVPVVYDSVGRDTFDKSLECLAVRGMLVSFGQSSGPVPPFNPLRLSAKSLFLTRPSLMHYTAKRAELVASAEALFGMVARGVIESDPRQRYALKDARKAHEDLEARRTTGSTILVP